MEPFSIVYILGTSLEFPDRKLDSPKSQRKLKFATIKVLNLVTSLFSGFLLYILFL